MSNLTKTEVAAILQLPATALVADNQYQQVQMCLYKLEGGDHLLVNIDGTGVRFDPQTETVDVIQI